ncbi:cupin domain-containing protein [Streptomyces sp. Tue6028]|uniref:cupin domain-containing protein n=1 Tax=Streptomyces sp. Tue6028 TaxID=2036037 RepID=UPI003D75BC8D
MTDVAFLACEYTQVDTVAPEDTDVTGVTVRPLWVGPQGAVAQVVEIRPGANLGQDQAAHDTWMFVLEGTLHDGLCDHPTGSWLWCPAGARRVWRSGTEDTCRVLHIRPESVNNA